MSEPALKPALSGTGLSSAASATGTYRALTGGKTVDGTGNSLPRQAVEKPDMTLLAQELNNASRRIGRDLKFQVDLDLGYAVIQVLDRETGEIIRQIPEDKAALMVAGNGSIEMRLFDDRA